LEIFDHRVAVVSYHCARCGFCANSDVGDDPQRLPDLAKKFWKFVKRSVLATGSEAIFAGRKLVWWPGEFQTDGQIEIVPIARDRRLLWRCRHQNGVSSDHKTFTQAVRTSRKLHQTLAIATRSA
jgi:hypothetical protein